MLAERLPKKFGLGEEYPEALAALRRVRDRKAADLLGGRGTREWFHDVTSINDHLGESDRNYPLFQRILELDESLARQCGNVALADIVRARGALPARVGEPRPAECSPAQRPRA